MVNVGMKNAQEVTIELKKHEALINDIEFLYKLQFCFELHNIIKNTDIEAIKIELTKDEYNDEGLDCGVYFDYRTKTVDYCQDYLDESAQYFEKIGQDWGNSDSTEAEKAEFTKYSGALAQLNSLATSLHGTGEKLSYIIDDLSAVELKNDLNSIVLAICGKNYYDKWKITIEKTAIEKSTPLINDKKIANKKIKL